MSTPYPFEWVPIREADKATKFKSFPMENSVEVDMVRSVPGEVHMPRAYAEEAVRLYNFETRPDDVWVVTYPKCGTTWMKEIVWLITHDMDTETAAKTDELIRSPFLELGALMSPQFRHADMPLHEKDPISFADNMAADSRRVLTTHMPIEFLPPDALKKNKIVYVCRNPKDMAYSFYKFCQLRTPEIVAEFEDFVPLVKAGTLIYGSYWHHLKGAWEKRDEKNLKFIWYEDLKVDTHGVCRDLSEFLLDTPLDDAQLSRLLEHTTIDSMRRLAVERDTGSEGGKEFFAKFFRKGQVGDWKTRFTPELLTDYEEWIDANAKKIKDVKITYQ